MPEVPYDEPMKRRSWLPALLAMLLLACGGASPGPRLEAGHGARCAGKPLTCRQLVERYLANADEAPLVAMELEPECEAGRADACLALGYFLIDGEEVSHEPGRAARLLGDGCDVGDGRACHRLGELLQGGEPNDEEDARAVRALGQGCDAGVLESCASLARMHQLGRGGERSEERAAELYARACDGSVLPACGRLADLMITRERWSALPQIFLRMCDGGEPIGCTRLARLQEERRVAAETLTIRGLYERACASQEPEACTRLGSASSLGELDLLADPARAAGLFRRTCERDHWPACSELGRLYEQGRGVDRDADYGLALHTRACDHRDGLGCFYLGLAHEEGNVAGASDERAVELFRMSCQAGVARACGHLASAHDRGVGVRENRAEAVSLYHRACDAGEPDSCARLSVILRGGDGVPQDSFRSDAYRDQACAIRPYPEICLARRWSRRQWSGEVVQAGGLPLEVGARCAIGIDQVLQPHWCRVRIACSETDLLAPEGAWLRCELGTAGRVAISDQIDSDTGLAVTFATEEGSIRLLRGGGTSPVDVAIRVAP